MQAIAGESIVRTDNVANSFPGAPHRILAVGPHEIAHWKFGTGPDIVFAHGWPLHSATFRALVPMMADFTCHLIDLPGSGHTRSPADAPLDFQAQAEAVHGFIDALGLSRFALVAHDSGGFIARVLAARDPRVVALVSGDTEIPGHTPGIIKTLLAAAHLPGGAEILRFAMHARAMRRSSRGYGGCFADLNFLDGEFHELLVAPILGSRTAWAKQIAILKTFDDTIHDRIRDAHAKIDAPVLFVWGDADPIFPVAKARAMLSQLKDARLVTIAGGKAFVHEERPGEFAAYAVPFLRQAFTRTNA